jgi:hypothetical protein
VCPGSRDPEIVIDHIDVLPAQRTCTIDRAYWRRWLSRLCCT